MVGSFSTASPLVPPWEMVRGRRTPDGVIPMRSVIQVTVITDRGVELSYEIDALHALLCVDKRNRTLVCSPKPVDRDFHLPKDNFLSGKSKKVVSPLRYQKKRVAWSD